MRWSLSIATGIVLAFPVLAANDVPLAVAGFQAANPAAQLDFQGGRLRQIAGVPVAFGSSPVDSATAFMQANAGLFGVEAADLAPGNHFNDLVSIPVMYDAESDSYKFTLVYYAQYRNGIPVFRGEARCLVRNVGEFPLVLVNANIREVSNFTPAAATQAAPFSRVEQIAPNMTSFSEPRLVVWAGVDDMVVAPVLAIAFEADNYDDAAAAPEKWLYVADAATGAVLYRENKIIFTNITGNVQGKSTTPPKADVCNPEPAVPMKYATVSVAGGGSTYTDASGNFTLTYSGTSPVSVTSSMAGHYFTVDNLQGAEENLSTTITPPGPANFVHNNDNTSEQVRAQINGYMAANVVREFTLAQNPSYPTIATQTGFPIKVNSTDSTYCPGNAWYDGTSITCCQSGGGYSNTAFSNVVHHEYGHHIVEMGGSGQGEYGEGMGDCVGVLIADDPVIGYGFSSSNCSSGIRTANNDCQYSASGCSSCGSEIHDCGNLLSGCIWSTRNQLVATEPATYLAILSSLTINSVLVHTGESIAPPICIDFLVLDDDDADLTNGTPHFGEITAGFGMHGMWTGLPVDNDDCSQAVAVCPGTYTGTTAGMTVDGSASCGASSSTPDVWFRYTPTAGGTLNLDLCDSDYDTVVSVHTGCPGTSSNQVGCNDDAGWFTCAWFSTNKSILDVTVSAGMTYYVRVSGSGGATGNYVLAVSGPACAPESDTTPPTPNPMTFSSPPASVAATIIEMTAVTAVDVASPPVEYQFEFVSGGSGGNSSGWQAGRTYSDGGLTPNTVYTYRVRARDSAATPNVTSFSGNSTTTTWAAVPGAPILGGATISSLTVDVNANGNPASTEFAIRCLVVSGTDPAWSGKYIDASGHASTTPVWRTDAQWGVTTVLGLQAGTAYPFAVEARNSVGVETAFGPTVSLTTLTPYVPGDLNCDGAVNTFDIDPFVLALTDPAAYQAQHPTCNRMLADINGDGVVNAFDIDPFVLVLTGG
jgi:hypothetical protein